LAEVLAVAQVPEIGVDEELAEGAPDSEGSVLDALFDSVELATDGSGSGI
jgi:hypothetical protein